MSRIIFASFFLMAIALGIEAHKYNLGKCPVVEPMITFDMKRMLGVWYAVEKTKTKSSCITYNFTETGLDEYELEQVSQRFSFKPLNHKFRYIGYLHVAEPSLPAKMTVRFALSLAGTASYSVIDTDYDTYAGIFTCQKLPFSHRQSATILSRTPTLDKANVDKIKEHLKRSGVDPADLDKISQGGCVYESKPGEVVQISVRNNFEDDEEEANSKDEKEDVWLP